MSESGIVIGVSSARCRLFIGGREVDCVVPSAIARRQRSALAVGDRITAEPVEANLWRLIEILPRRTVLSRPDPQNSRVERLIAANIDLAVNVVSIKSPPLRPRLIDRFLIAIARGGAQAAICVNKIDLAGDRDAALEPLRTYEQLGVPLVPCSTKSGEGIGALRAIIEGKTCAFVGHSGVGKSSILNALDASLRLPTANVSEKHGTGRHTTTASTLLDLGDETYVIDTPGIREFGLWDITPEALREAFPEFGEAAEWCRFNDCTHTHEPDCEVKRRVERGEINPARYETYRRLTDEVNGTM
jgi:ribosome biogenesis GTPase / thiamine phosphate phosphatase